MLETIESQVKLVEEEIPTFLTFPTGWRYQKNIGCLRKTSLELIRLVINQSIESLYNKQE